MQNPRKSQKLKKTNLLDTSWTQHWSTLEVACAQLGRSFHWNRSTLTTQSSKWVITPVINGISRVNPRITGVITHLLSGMSHQVNIDIGVTKDKTGLLFPATWSPQFRSAPLGAAGCIRSTNFWLKRRVPCPLASIFLGALRGIDGI